MHIDANLTEEAGRFAHVSVVCVYLRILADLTVLDLLSRLERCGLCWLGRIELKTM
jgi:hypothetical protein